MPVSYTNRKGVTYTLYRGQTRTGKPRYYFGLPAHSQGEPVMEIPPGFTISESVNGVVSLVKDRPSLVQPEEVAAVEAAVQQHPEAHRYRVAVKGNRIEVYEQVGPDYNELVSELHIPGPRNAQRVLTHQESGLKASFLTHPLPEGRAISDPLPVKSAGIERACEAPLAESASRCAIRGESHEVGKSYNNEPSARTFPSFF